MAVLFTLIFLAAIVGTLKPYVKGSKRWHFGLAAFISFIAIGVTAPATSDEDPAKVANAELGNKSDLQPDESWTPAKTPRFEAVDVIHSVHWTDRFYAPTQPVFAGRAPGAAEQGWRSA